MNKIRNIMVVVDPTVERDYVIDRAKLLAQATGAGLTFYINNANTLTEHSYIYEGVDGDFFERQRKLFAEHYQKLLEEVVSECEKEKLRAKSRFTEKHHLAEAVIEEVDTSKPDLVLKSTHHHGVLERALITNTDWRLIRKCPAPLLLVKANAWRDEGCVVTAIDPMHGKDEQARLDHVLLAAADQLSRQLNQPARVFHSYYPFVSTLFPLGGESKEHLGRIRDFHLSKIRDLLEEHSLPEEAIELSEGELAPSLVNYLGKVNANVLVIGALSRNIIERAIVGNTAERILEDCPCDVLVMKS